MSRASTEYAIYVKNPAGTIQAIIDQPRQFSYVKEVNAPGLLTFSINPEHHAVQYLETDAQIEVWRWTEDIAPYCDFFGFFRQEDYQIDANGVEYLFAYCPGQMDLLERAVIAYPAETADRSKFTADPAETIMKTLVTRNATASGTVADGRIRNVDTWGGFVSVQADGANGNVLDYNCFGQNLLTTLQNLAQIGGGDFNLVKTGAMAWEFRWYTGQLGSDVSSTVIFSLDRGNMLRGSIKNNTLKERTVAIVGGQGEGAARMFVTRTGTNYNATINSREYMINGSQYSTVAGLENFGDVSLQESRAFHDFQFEIRQIESTLYGIHFNVGDLVRGIHREFNETKQVWAVTISYDDSASGRGPVENIRAVLKNP